jgi:histidine phosphotransfer protein HptB
MLCAGECDPRGWTAMIDWARVNELREEIGDDGFSEVVELFLDEVEDVIRRLASAPDPLRFEEDLHFLKGSAWNLGFREMGKLCQIGEKRASEGDHAIDIAEVLASYARSKDAFVRGLAERAAGRGSSAA